MTHLRFVPVNSTVWKTSQHLSITVCESCKLVSWFKKNCSKQALEMKTVGQGLEMTKDKLFIFAYGLPTWISASRTSSHITVIPRACDSVFKGNYQYKIGKRFYCNTFPKHWISAHFLNNILPHDESLPEQNKWKIVKVSGLSVSGWAEINKGPGYVTHNTWLCGKVIYAG